MLAGWGAPRITSPELHPHKVSSASFPPHLFPFLSPAFSTLLLPHSQSGWSRWASTSCSGTKHVTRLIQSVYRIPLAGQLVHSCHMTRGDPIRVNSRTCAVMARSLALESTCT